MPFSFMCLPMGVMMWSMMLLKIPPRCAFFFSSCFCALPRDHPTDRLTHRPVLDLPLWPQRHRQCPLHPGTRHMATGLAKRTTLPPRPLCQRTIVLVVTFWETRTDVLTCPAVEQRTSSWWRRVPEVINDSSVLLFTTTKHVTSS